MLSPQRAPKAINAVSAESRNCTYRLEFLVILSFCDSHGPNFVYLLGLASSLTVLLCF